MKIIKRIFFFLMLIILLIGICYATDSSNDTITPEVIKNTNHIEHETIKEIKDYKKENPKVETITKVSATKSTIGENLVMKAQIHDSNNKPVDTGFILFKLNGITIKDNRKLTGSNNPLKVYVKNGTATTTVTADLSMRYAQNLTAVYSGSVKYNSSRSNTAKAQIKQRNASIIVSSNTLQIKQGQILTIKAQIYDTTNNKENSNLIPYEDEFVYFKINGLTLKNTTGQMLKTKVVNGVATTTYTIPLGLSGVTDAQSLTVKNHTILAGFYNKNYLENIRNTSTFQTERSPITININNATINNKNHRITVSATIKDYLSNNVRGPNKCILKINGVSLKNGTQPQYFYSTDGLLSIKDTPVPIQDKYTSIEIVTQDRLAYKNGRNTTTKLNIIKQDTIIKIDTIAKTDYNKLVSVTGRITGKANENFNNKTLTVNLNGVSKNVNTDNRGYFTYTNQTNKVGTNSITVLFDGDSNYLSTNSKTTFEVIHKPTLIDFSMNNVNVGEYTEIKGFLSDKDHNKLKSTRIILNINGETYYTRTDEIGEFSYTYQTKKAGKNNITISFDGTEYYNRISKSKTFNVYKKESMIFLDKTPESVSLGDYVILSGEVIDNNNNPIRNCNITIKVNNQRFNLKTDNYGVFSYNYKITTVGINRIEATVNDENYQTSTDLRRLEVIKTYNITLNFYKTKSDEKIVYSDRFSSFYEPSTEGQWMQGAYVIVEDIYGGIEMPPKHLLINATFYFKNSKGNIISREFTDYNGYILSHELISGYTPLKVTATYREMTDEEQSLANNGYEYNPIYKEWIQTYDPYEYTGGET